VPRVPFEEPTYSYLWSHQVSEPTPVDIITGAGGYLIPLRFLNNFKTLDFKQIESLPHQISLYHQIDIYLSGYLAGENRERLLIPGEASVRVNRTEVDLPTLVQKKICQTCIIILFTISLG